MSKKYIDADEIIYEEFRFELEDGDVLRHICASKESIDKIPAADVVEVVRCKDCRYMLQTEGCALDRDRFMREEEDYCSWAERRTG